MPPTDHPSGDKRFKMLDATMKRHQYRADALIEVLHKAQDLFGHLQEDLLLYVSRHLKLPTSWVYGVATFYHLFSFAPRGEHTCVLCLGTACYVKGAARLQATLEHVCETKLGETSPDGKVSLLGARCIGACGLAPVVVFDGATEGHLSDDDVLQRVSEWRADGTD